MFGGSRMRGVVAVAALAAGVGLLLLYHRRCQQELTKKKGQGEKRAFKPDDSCVSTVPGRTTKPEASSSETEDGLHEERAFKPDDSCVSTVPGRTTKPEAPSSGTEDGLHEERAFKPDDSCVSTVPGRTTKPEAPSSETEDGLHEERAFKPDGSCVSTVPGRTTKPEAPSSETEDGLHEERAFKPDDGCVSTVPGRTTKPEAPSSETEDGLHEERAFKPDDSCVSTVPGRTTKPEAPSSETEDGPHEERAFKPDDSCVSTVPGRTTKPEAPSSETEDGLHEERASKPDDGCVSTVPGRTTKPEASSSETEDGPHEERASKPDDGCVSTVPGRTTKPEAPSSETEDGPHEERASKPDDGCVSTVPGRTTKPEAPSSETEDSLHEEPPGRTEASSGEKENDLKQESDKELALIRKHEKEQKEKLSRVPLRKNTNLWLAETGQGSVCFELDKRYSMGETLGVGAYGVVVSGVDNKNKTEVAIKKVASAFDAMLDAKRMIREIRLLQQLEHHNIIKLVDMLPPPSVGSFEDIYMVLERMNVDLDRMIQIVGSNLEEDRYKSILYQILCGVFHMHSARVLHRDLKPANVLLNENGDVKICDFGLARSLGGASDFKDSDSADSFDLTEYVASRWWRAPEVLLDAKYGTSIDVWSAGCIMAEMLQGEPLFMGSTTAEMLRLIVKFNGKPSKADVNFVTSRKVRKYVLGMTEGPRVSLRKQFPGAGRDAHDLLARMLTFDPAKRISARDAMRHPWLAKFHQVADETPAPKLADLAAVEDPSLTRHNLQQLMFEDVCAFHPECIAMAPGGR